MIIIHEMFLNNKINIFPEEERESRGNNTFIKFIYYTSVELRDSNIRVYEFTELNEMTNIHI